MNQDKRRTTEQPVNKEGESDSSGLALNDPVPEAEKGDLKNEHFGAT